LGLRVLGLGGVYTLAQEVCFAWHRQRERGREREREIKREREREERPTDIGSA